MDTTRQLQGCTGCKNLKREGPSKNSIVNTRRQDRHIAFIRTNGGHTRYWYVNHIMEVLMFHKQYSMHLVNKFATNYVSFSVL